MWSPPVEATLNAPDRDEIMPPRQIKRVNVAFITWLDEWYE
jgi:hypothetical protein